MPGTDLSESTPPIVTRASGRGLLGCARPSGRLVVIDQDPELADLWADVAETSGFAAYAMTDCVEALRVCRRCRVELAVVDLGMPYVDGLAFLRAIADGPDAPAVILTSHADEGVLDTARHYAETLGIVVRAVLAKPFTLVAFEAALRPGRVSAAALPPFTGETRAPLDELPDDLAGALVAFLQPQVALADGRIVGFESLARLRLPSGALVAPHLFFDRVRRDGRMRELTNAMLDATLAALGRLRETTAVDRASFNVSADVLAAPGFVDDVVAALRRTATPTWALTLEITEDEAVRQDGATLAALVRLRLLGVGLAIDDFGMGHSTLSQTGRVPATELKLDRSFIVGMNHSGRARTIVSSVCRMGRELGMRVVAEGIESLDDVPMLIASGCTVGQGYAYGRPMPEAEFAAHARECQPGMRGAA